MKYVGWLTVLLVLFFGFGWFFDWTSLSKENGAFVGKLDGVKVVQDLHCAGCYVSEFFKSLGHD